jgi:hypothetical protein
MLIIIIFFRWFFSPAAIHCPVDEYHAKAEATINFQLRSERRETKTTRRSGSEHEIKWKSIVAGFEKQKSARSRARVREDFSYYSSPLCAFHVRLENIYLLIEIFAFMPNRLLAAVVVSHYS